MRYNRLKNFFGDEVNFAAGQLFFKAAHNGRGEHNITNGRKTYDENFHALRLKQNYAFSASLFNAVSRLSVIVSYASFSLAV